jgi:hypothetical protein
MKANRIYSVGAGSAVFVLIFCILSGYSFCSASQAREILRYEVIWNGNKAAHGDVTTHVKKGEISIVAQAVTDGMVKTIFEIWSRAQGSFAARSLKPRWYNFHLKSNVLATEHVDLSFDHTSGLVKVSKQKGDEREEHSEKIGSVYDPITASYLLRNQSFLKPSYVDIYDGKDRARLFVNPAGKEKVRVPAGSFPAMRLHIRLVKLSGDKKEVAKGNLWISDDGLRIPLLLTSSPVVGTVRFELVAIENHPN